MLPKVRQMARVTDFLMNHGHKSQSDIMQNCLEYQKDYIKTVNLMMECVWLKAIEISVCLSLANSAICVHCKYKAKDSFPNHYGTYAG